MNDVRRDTEEVKRGGTMTKEKIYIFDIVHNQI